MVMVGSIGTDVNSAETSYEEMHLLGWGWIPWTCCTKSLVFLIKWGKFPMKDLRILASSFATSYVVEPLLETIDLRGVSFL